MCFLCGFPDTSAEVMVAGKKVRFEFSDNFGPVIIDQHGVPLEHQPVSERHPFWAPFNAWLSDYRKTHPRTKPRHAAQMNRDPQP